jgi:2-alkenal reductase
MPGGPAEQAGVRGGSGEAEVWGRSVTVGGDIIVAIDGHPVEDFNGLVSYLILETEVGQTVTLTVLRDGETLQIPVELGERP